MKNLLKFTCALFVGLVTAALVAVPVANFLEINPVAATAGVFAAPFAIKMVTRLYLGFAPRQVDGFAIMAVQKETWVDYIMGNLFRNNEFLEKCYDESDYVLDGKVVHIPQAGAKPRVVKNRSLLPAQATVREDSEVNYDLDSYTTDPTVIRNAEEKEVSYQKMDSVLGEHVDTLGDDVADDVLYKWAPTVAENITRTTGAADDVALAPEATGNRKALLAKDLRIVQAKMNKDGIPKTNRFAQIPEDMMTQLMEDPKLTGSQIQLLLDAKEGKVVKLFGFEILTRVNSGIYDNSGTPVPKDPKAAGAATDNLAVLCWHMHSVAKAKGPTEFFEDKNSPYYYGDAYSIEQRCGARKRRKDGKGVHAIVQTT